MNERIIRDGFVPALNCALLSIHSCFCFLVTKSSCDDGRAVTASGLNGMQAKVRKPHLLYSEKVIETYEGSISISNWQQVGEFHDTASSTAE